MSAADYREALIQSLEDLADEVLCLEHWSEGAPQEADMLTRSETLRRRCDELRAVLGMNVEVQREG